MTVLSLKLYRNSDNSALAYLNAYSKECITYSDYSSCSIDSINSRNSRLRVLLTDLEEGESGQYTCIASVIRSGEEAQVSSWSIVVTRNSECIAVCVVCVRLAYWTILAVLVVCVCICLYLFVVSAPQSVSMSCVMFVCL